MLRRKGWRSNHKRVYPNRQRRYASSFNRPPRAASSSRRPRYRMLDRWTAASRHARLSLNRNRARVSATNARRAAGFSTFFRAAPSAPGGRGSAQPRSALTGGSLLPDVAPAALAGSRPAPSGPAPTGSASRVGGGSPILMLGRDERGHSNKIRPHLISLCTEAAPLQGVPLRRREK